jgi:HNH endonuclease
MIRRRRPPRPYRMRPGVTAPMPATWKKICREVRERDKACRRCGVTGAGARYDINHIIPRRIADPLWANDSINLALLCDHCHAMVTHYYEPRLYEGDVLAYDVFLRTLARTGPVPLEAMRAFAYGQVTEAIRASG